MRRPLPIGTSNFKEIIENNYCYIDKTLLIRDVITYGGKVVLLPRPRRFGKTLNLSMLRYFFEYTEISNDYLFQNLKIWQEEDLCILQGQSPVIFLTFKSIKENTWERAYQSLIAVIQDEFERHAKILLPTLSPRDTIIFESILSGTATESTYKRSFLFLSRLLTEYYKQPVVFLLDEYDTPIITAYQNSYYPEMLEFLKSLLSNVLKDNSFLARGIITGIARIAKEGIFSELNNLTVLSILQKPAADKFGFTQEETTQLLEEYGRTDQLDIVKTWYNGYRIGQIESMYNPWSVLNYIHFEGELRAYWGQTSSNDLIKRLIRICSADIKQELQFLLQDAVYTRRVDHGLILPDIDRNAEAIWSLLLYTGYLTVTDMQLIDAYDYCTLKIPNFEMHCVYNRLITDIMEETLNLSDLQFLLQAMTEGNGEVFGRYLQEFVLNSMSHHDIVEPMPENSYHMFVLGILMFLQKDYEVKSNRESGFGRYDIMLIPRNLDALGIVMEFKKCDPKESLEQGRQRALQQIQDKNYVQELRSRGIKKIIGYGIAFQGKNMQLESCVLEKGIAGNSLV